MLLVTIFLILLLVAVIYLFLSWNNDHWKKRGVNGPKPALLLGNYPSIYTQKRHMILDIGDVYRKYKNTDDFVGIYSSRTPQLLITSPSLARRILVTDFKHFHDNEASTMVDEKSDFIFANNPFALVGENWKQRRAEITPGLTGSRVKTVYPVTNKVCNKLNDYIEKQIRVSPKDGINAKEISLKFTSEVVSDCVLGINAGSFSDNPSPIYGMIKNIFDHSFVFFLYMALVNIFPQIKRIYKLRFISKSAEIFFKDLMQNAIDLRKSQKSVEDRTDFLNYMLQLQQKKKLSTMELTAHTMTFLLDGFETTATVISHCLLFCGRNPKVQEKLRAEFNEHLDSNGIIDFDNLNDELPYLDACIHETIRLFPPGAFTNKICTEPIELTNKNGRSLLVKKGDVVVLPLHSIMTDEEYYSDPHEFKPERFLDDGVKKYREMGLYYGFGDGPRVCLGMRFALAQAKAAIVEIVNNYNIHINPKTIKDNTYDPLYFLLSLNGGIWLDLESRK